MVCSVANLRERQETEQHLKSTAHSLSGMLWFDMYVEHFSVGPGTSVELVDRSVEVVTGRFTEAERVDTCRTNERGTCRFDFDAWNVDINRGVGDGELQHVEVTCANLLVSGPLTRQSESWRCGADFTQS